MDGHWLICFLKLTEMTESSHGNQLIEIDWNDWIQLKLKSMNLSMDQREDLQGWTMTKALLGIPGSGAMAPMTSSSDRCCQMGKDLPGGTCRNDTGVKGSLCTLCSPWSWPISHFSDVLQKPSAQRDQCLHLVPQHRQNVVTFLLRAEDSEFNQLSMLLVQICAFVMNAYIKMV